MSETNGELDKRLTAEVTALDKRLTAEVTALDRLTESRFVTHRTMLEGNAEKTSLALAASDKAITKAEIASERRFESVNEFRSALSDSDRENVKRREYISAHESLREQIERNEKTIATLIALSQGRTEQKQESRSGIGTSASVIGAVVAAVVVFLAFLNYQALHKSTPTTPTTAVCSAAYHPASVCPAP